MKIVVPEDSEYSDVLQRLLCFSIVGGTAVSSVLQQ